MCFTLDTTAWSGTIGLGRKTTAKSAFRSYFLLCFLPFPVGNFLIFFQRRWASTALGKGFFLDSIVRDLHWCPWTGSIRPGCPEKSPQNTTLNLQNRDAILFFVAGGFGQVLAGSVALTEAENTWISKEVCKLQSEPPVLVESSPRSCCFGSTQRSPLLHVLNADKGLAQPRSTWSDPGRGWLRLGVDEGRRSSVSGEDLLP